MFLPIDPGSGVPIYRQIMDGVRYSVANGVLAAGERLPSVRELATTLGVNPTTIQKAYGELEHHGVIETRRGQGTFVAPTPPPVPADEYEETLVREAREWIVRAAARGADREALEGAFRRALDEFGNKE